MISFLKGEIFFKDEHGLELVSGGVGYRVFCSPKTAGVYSVGGNAEIFIHHHVREDALQLYGFETRQERDFFEVLLGISGIGPKIALGVLSAAPVDTLKKAIASGDPALLPRVSGIGPKIASRIVMELKDKIEDFAGDDAGSLREGGDIIEALTGLGYSRYQAQQALREISKDVHGVENKVKAALKILGQ